MSPKDIEKIKADHRKWHAREFAPIMFETTTGARLTKGETPPPPRELFGPLWRTGELAILAGPNGVGKTLLAIHLAESLARGVNAVDSGQLRIDSSSENSPPSTVNSQLAPQPVLYIDLCHSLDQFRQRYTCPSIFPERPPVKYRFSSRFHRAGFDKNFVVPEAFEGKFLDYYNHSIKQLIARTRAKVIIIDDLAALTPTTLSTSAQARVLFNLKTFTAHQEGISILVLMDCKQKVKTKRSATSVIHHSSLTIHHSLLSIADSAFSLAPSTFSPDIRYIKSLKSTPPCLGGVPAGRGGSSENFPLSTINCQLSDGVVDSSAVYTFQLQNTPGPREASKKSRRPCIEAVPADRASKSSPPCLGGVAAGRGGSSSDSKNSQLSTVNSQLNAAPFLGFTYLGTCQEQQHLRDYAAEALAATRAHEAQLKKLWRRSPKEILVDGVIDGSYGKYLKGE